MNFLSLETTGLDPKKDRVYLANVLVEDRYEGVLVQGPEDLAFLAQAPQAWMTYRGRLFEARFFQALGLAVELEDFYPDLRRYYQARGWSLGLEALAQRFGLELPASRQRAYEAYEADPSFQTLDRLLQAGEANVRLRQAIYRAYEGLKAADAQDFYWGQANRASLLAFELVQDTLVLHYETAQPLGPTSLQTDHFLLEDEPGGLRLAFILDKGSYQGQKARAFFWEGQVFLVQVEDLRAPAIRALGARALASLDPA